MKVSRMVPSMNNKIIVVCCDLCGGEALQDSLLFRREVCGLNLDLHNECWSKVYINARKALGLREMVYDGRSM